MAKKGQKRHQKRLSAPAKLRIPRKTTAWAVKPAPGPHPADECLPLSMLVRDYLGLARTGREANKILGKGQVQVDGKTRKDPKFPVGLMDVVRVPGIGESWRIVFDRKGYLAPYAIPGDEVWFKLAKVVGKILVKGSKTQISFHDGKTCIGDFGVSSNDVVKLNLPKIDVVDRFSFGKGRPALITGGSQVGRFGVISEVEEHEHPSTDIATVKVEDESFQASCDHVFVIGREEPVISLPRWLNESYA